MPKKSKHEASKTRERILASALSLFVGKGYEKTSFSDIAARLKMTKGAVFWHFDSKETLLLALIDRMLGKFRRQLESRLPAGDDPYVSLGFRAVAAIMVELAEGIVSDVKGAAFFLLLHEQIRWSHASMGKVLEDLMTNERFGPWHAIRTAVENDKRRGLAAEDADPAAVATVCMSAWDGAVHGRIAGILKSDLTATLDFAYGAVWEKIRKRGR